LNGVFFSVLELKIRKTPLEWRIFGFSKGRERLRVGEEEFGWCFPPVQVLEFEINKSRTRWGYFLGFQEDVRDLGGEKVPLFL
jgi:hypothetical protein